MNINCIKAILMTCRVWNRQINTINENYNIQVEVNRDEALEGSCIIQEVEWVLPH